MADGSYPWEAHIQRQILHCAVTGTLLQTPTVVTPAHFGGEQTPRGLIAKCLAEHGKIAPGERPGIAALHTMLTHATAHVSEEERRAIDEEWAEVQTVVVDNPTWIYATVREWAKQQAMEMALLEAADMLERARRVGGPVDDAAWTAMLTKPTELTDPAAVLAQPLIDRTDPAALRRFYQRMEHGVRVPTGFSPLDRALDGGVPLGQVYYVLGEPKGGKTACLLNMALGAARRGHGVLLASFEMSFDAMVDRCLRSITNAARSELLASPLRAERGARGWIASGAGTVWLCALSVGRTVADITKLVMRLRGEGQRIDLVIFDYLNIMTSAQREREKRHELTRISREMMACAKALQIAVWSAALVNRKAIDKPYITKADIGEAFEVIAVLDGVAAICATDEMRKHDLRRLWLTAMRHAGDDRAAGLYVVNFSTMRFVETDASKYRDMLARPAARTRPVVRPVAQEAVAVYP